MLSHLVGIKNDRYLKGATENFCYKLKVITTLTHKQITKMNQSKLSPVAIDFLRGDQSIKVKRSIRGFFKELYRCIETPDYYGKLEFLAELNVKWAEELENQEQFWKQQCTTYQDYVPPTNQPKKEVTEMTREELEQEVKQSRYRIKTMIQQVKDMNNQMQVEEDD